MVKSGKSFVKIGSRLQITLFFLLYRNFQPPHHPHSPTPAAYFILPNIPTPPSVPAAY